MRLQCFSANQQPAFSATYQEARARFRAAATQASCLLETHPIKATGPQGDTLSIDVAIREAKADDSKTLFVSSGLHGVEGFLGSAVQIRLLQELDRLAQEDSALRIVLIHALNPYGFAWLRRANEDNVDVNRNFLPDNDSYSGAKPGYIQVADLLAPTAPPSRLHLFWLGAALAMLRFGLAALVRDVPAGQYDFPKGIFFGGKESSATKHIVADNIARWVGESEHVLFLDFHTGLFKSGDYRLIQDFETEPLNQASFERSFTHLYCPKNSSGSLSYKARGTLGRWLSRKFGDRDFHFLFAEFGTANELRVLERLRAENQNYWWGERNSINHWTKRDLLEAFFPSSPKWRRIALEQSMALIGDALAWLKKAE